MNLSNNYKNKQPVINEEERRNIVQNIKAVDQAEIATTLDKKASWEEFAYDAIFVGDDWAQDARWLKTKEELNEQGSGCGLSSLYERYQFNSNYA
jgi:glycerol-3-phosphate cytidylyltransferase